jgi:quercetin 2,3-dioxygenase
MFWDKDIPTLSVKDDSSDVFTKIKTVAGIYKDATPPSPPPNSWASDPHSDVAIWTIQMPKGAKWTLPASDADLNRVLYFFEGEELHIDGQPVSVGHGIKLKSDAATPIYNETAHSELLLLQGRPLGEPVVQYGPFVMNTEGEVHQAMSDYQRTQFGGWPWKRRDPVHGISPTRFAVHSDGRREEA